MVATCTLALGLLFSPWIRQGNEEADRKRGAEIFKATARKLGGEAAAGLKLRFPEGYEDLLKQAAAKTEQEAGNWLGDELLKKMESALALSEEKAKVLRSGKCDDEGNRKSYKERLAECMELKLPLPGFIVGSFEKWQAGTLKGGLELEFALRLLTAHIEMCRKK